MLMLPLIVNSLNLILGDNTLLKNVSLRIDNPDITVIMGPNGAGKSLLLRVLHGLIAPSSGRVEWNGEIPDEKVRKRQAMVFQRPALLRRSVRANMEFVIRNGSRVGTGHTPQLCAELLERVGLSHIQNRPARKLSGGEQQRLALARALAIEPEVLLLDEPSASLDPASTLTIESVVRNMKATKTKIIFVTHDISQAKRIADEIVFLNQGQLVEHTPARQFFEKPQSRAAQRFLEGEIIL